MRQRHRSPLGDVDLVLAAHGTRNPVGVSMIGDLAHRVGAHLGQPVRVGFVDVLGPTPAEILASTGRRRAVVVPAFLSRGYHVNTDLPAQVAASGRCDVTLGPALGPSPELAHLIARQLVDLGWRHDDSVILAAAGSSDPLAHRDLRATTDLLSRLIGSQVVLAFACAGEPGVPAAVAAARRHCTGRVVVASYLLADGLFQQRLRNSGADLITEPLGSQPGLAELVTDRFHHSLRQAAAA